ncbi:TMEM56 [Branchiostoma lanceolatum]|uniref:TMEM56 protein n=1 Tax=Branchiostoma lanceolatum TaxID=7740 RepID=A0A8K0EY82_BRALA|nr:TMEM56 [Branchiostoma lanceolatum]
MSFETLLVVTAASSCATWMAVFALSPALFTWLSLSYRSLPNGRQRLVDNHFKTVVHGTFVAALAWYAYTCTEIPPEGVWLNAPLVRFESAIYFGYLLSDLIQTAMYPHVSNIEFVSHHVLSLYSSFIAASYPAMPYYANICHMMQLSNPSGFFRVILEELGFKDSKYYVWNGITLLVTCFISRILVTSIATINLAKIVLFQDALSQLPFHVSSCYIFGSLFFNTMNYYWFGLICKGFVDYFWGKETKQKL